MYTVITEAGDLSGKKVLVRVDLNVPIEEGKVRNDFRIQKTLPTIEFLRKQGAKVILLSHIGREATESLKDVAEQLNEQVPLTFVPDISVKAAHDTVDAMCNGDVVLFENLRQYEAETANDPDFAKHLASFGDIYVNEAFSNSHRDHASMTGLAKLLPAYAGIRLDEEVRMLSKAFNPEHPFVLIVGGAKFETKLPLIKKFSAIADKVFIGGALANDVYRFYGYEMGKSLVSETPLSEIAAILDTGRVMVPSDVVTTKKEVKHADSISPEDTIADSGVETIETLRNLIGTAKFIIWNGPLGLYENGFPEATDTLMKMIIDADAEAIVGGGDTGLAASKFEATDEQVFVSTGGGAMLDFLADGNLVAIEALNK